MSWKSKGQIGDAEFLTYSPDEDVYYWTRYEDWKISQLFKTEEEAYRARSENKVTYN